METAGTVKYRCQAEGCSQNNKYWYRRDNFRAHCRRLHPSLNFSELMEKSMVSKKIDPSPVPEEPLEDAITSQRLPASAGSAMTRSPIVANDINIIEIDDKEVLELEEIMRGTPQVKKRESPTRNPSIFGVDDSTRKGLRNAMKCSACRQRKIKVSD